MGSFRQLTADHRYLVEIAAGKTGFIDPVVFDADDAHDDLLRNARPDEPLPVDGVLVRTWEKSHAQLDDGVLLGMRVWQIQGIRFAVVSADYEHRCRKALEFIAVERRDYSALRAIANQLAAQPQANSAPPIMPEGFERLLWDNTIGFLAQENINRFAKYGLRAHRGLLLTGPPGNGKTMACRWIWEECRSRDWERRLVTPDEYRAARQDGDVDHLFRVFDRGVIFFDDMDLALRDREKFGNTEDQSVFLTALDGMKVKTGVVFVFTTNCSLDMIDRAFKRPGRIDLSLAFKLPDAALRRRLIQRWHPDIREHIVEDSVVAATDGNSFAEIEELKNLLVMHFLNHGTWDWDRTFRQFHASRTELATTRNKVGSHAVASESVRAR
jgi:cell division protease FtsH